MGRDCAGHDDWAPMTGRSLRNRPLKTDTGRSGGRIAIIDDLRGLCILAVIASHAAALFAPRVTFLRCDVLGPQFIDCAVANFAALFIANVQAVVVFAFLSGLMVSSRPGVRIVLRSFRLILAALTGATLTVVLLSVGVIEGERFAGLVAALPYTNPGDRYWLASADWVDLGRLAIGIEYFNLVSGKIDSVSGVWPPLWCVPWFVLGWAALALACSLPRPWSAIVMACTVAASLVVGDQGILTAMVAGYLTKSFVGRQQAGVAAIALAVGLVLALLPAARAVPSNWLTWSLPQWLISYWQVLSAGLIVTGYLSLARKSGLPGLQWLGRNSLWVFTLHWPLLLLFGSIWISVGAPWTALAAMALAMIALPYCIALAALRPVPFRLH